jgi:hypothetical protein
MDFTELASFEAAHKHLPWPWLAIHGRAFAYVSGSAAIETRILEGEALVAGPSFPLPHDLHLPTTRLAAGKLHALPRGLRALAVRSDATLVALTGMAKQGSVLVTLGVGAEEVRSRVSTLLPNDFLLHAVAFDRSGTKLWVSAESKSETALLLLDAQSHRVLGALRSAPFPPPSVHELHVHPQDDAVLLLASCGQDGTFARVAGFAGDEPLTAIPTALDDAGDPAGFVGFSADGARVHLVEDAVLRTHAWPGLLELSCAELADDFASAYSGVVLSDRILLDGHDAEEGDEDLVMQFDRSALVGRVLSSPAPNGMWLGRLGADALVTIESKGEPSRGKVLRVRKLAD